MKLHLEPNDLLELTKPQKENLRNLWQPRLLDLVLAQVCVDVENDTYQYNLFIVGNISVHQGHQGFTVILKDLRKMTSASLEEQAVSEEVEEELDAETAPVFDEDNFATPDYQFDQYLKDDCLPLLNIGQMIEMLQKLGYGDNFFNVTIPLFEGECYTLSRDGYAGEFEGEELWALLWECIKEKL